jgi:hypothetical protein
MHNSFCEILSWGICDTKGSGLTVSLIKTMRNARQAVDPLET